MRTALVRGYLTRKLATNTSKLPSKKPTGKSDLVSDKFDYSSSEHRGTASLAKTNPTGQHW
jgi:hypothetical protein